MPPPIAKPIPAVAQIPEAVVIPLIFLSLIKIIPPPIKLIPLTTCAATRAVSNFDVSKNASLEISIINAEVKATITWVFIPACLFLDFRSYPIANPHKQAKIMAIKCLTSNIASKFLLKIVSTILAPFMNLEFFVLSSK